MTHAIEVAERENEMKEITRAKGGTGERVVNVAQIEIPDLWHIAMHLRLIGSEAMIAASEQVLDVWHLAHDLQDAIIEDDNS